MLRQDASIDLALTMADTAPPPPSSPSRRRSDLVNGTDPSTLREGEVPSGTGGLEMMVPGRVCLFGEHSDWAGSFTRFNSDITPGMTIVVGTNQGIHARVRQCAERKMVLTCTRNDGSKVGSSSKQEGLRGWGVELERRVMRGRGSSG